MKLNILEAFMKCPNCEKTEFEQMDLYGICYCDGYSKQLVESYVCMNCGRVELFMPQELINQRIEQKRVAEERRQSEENRKREEERLRNRMKELEIFFQDENHTLKELKEAQKELTEIQDKLNIQVRHTYFNV